MLTSQKTVVGDIVMSKHYSFRKAGRTGCILHIDHIVAVNHFLCLNQSIIVNGMDLNRFYDIGAGVGLQFFLQFVDLRHDKRVFQ